MESKDENMNEDQFMEQWGAYEHDEEYAGMREQERAWRKECEDLVDLDEFMTARMDEEESGDEEDEEVETESEGMEERVLAWMDYDGEAEEENMNESVGGEEEVEQPWLDGDQEAEEVASPPQLRKIVQTIGKATLDLEAVSLRINAPYPASLWIPGLHPETQLTAIQATGVAWTLDRLEMVQGAILADEQDLGKEFTALAVIPVQNDDRGARKTIWGEAKPTLIVTSFTGISAWIDVMRAHLDDVGYDIRYLVSTLNGRDLCKDEIQRQVEKKKASQEDPGRLIYVVDGNLITGCSDLSDCFGLKVIDGPGSLSDDDSNQTELFKAIKAIECPFTVLLTSTPPLTKRLGLANSLELINPDSKWDDLGVEYSQNPFDFDQDDPRAVLKATKRAVETHLGSGVEKKDNLQKIYQLVMLRREEEIDLSTYGESKKLDRMEMPFSESFTQSIEVVNEVLRVTLDSITITSRKKRQADDEVAPSQPKRLRRELIPQTQHSSIHTNKRDAGIAISAPLGILSSLWRSLQFWR